MGLFRSCEKIADIGLQSNMRGTIIMMVVLQGSSFLVFIQEIRQLSQNGRSPVEFEPVLLSSSSTNFTKVASISCKGTACVYLL